MLLSLHLALAVCSPHLFGGAATGAGAAFSTERQWDAIQACARLATGERAGPVATGVCIGVRGDKAYLLTANHAVPPGEGRTYEFFPRSGFPANKRTVFGGEIVLRVNSCDVALVELRFKGLPPPVCPLAAYPARPKVFPAPVLAAGCPGGVPPMAREVVLTGKAFVKRPGDQQAFFWRATAAPVGGMSGGPLLDSANRVVGICVASQGGDGYYAHADEIEAALRKGGFGWLIPAPP